MSESSVPSIAPGQAPAASGEPRPSSLLVLVLAWLAVGIPLLWGVWQTVQKAAVLFS